MLHPPDCFRRVAAWLAALAGLLAVTGSRAADAGPAAGDPRPALPLTRVAEVKAWSELAGRSLPVAIEGVVTLVSPPGNFFLHDGAMGIHVGASETGRRLQPGERVRVSGMTRSGAFAPSIEPGAIVSLGRGPLPAVRRASYNEVAAGTLDGEWLELAGVVCGVSLDPAAFGPVLTLAIDGRRLRASLVHAEKIDPDAFLDAEVRVRGVASGSFNRQRQLVEPVLRVPGVSAIVMTRPPPPDPFAVPVVPLGRLLGFSLEAPSPHMVRIRGVVTRQVSERVLFVREGNLGLKVETRAAARAQPGDDIEAAGFPTMSGGSAVLESAVSRVLGRGAPPAPVRPTVARLLDGTHSANLVSVQARLVDRVAAGGAVTLILHAGDQWFRAALPAAQAPDLPERNSLVDVTGICVVSELDDRSYYSPRAVTLLLTGPSDLAVVQRPDWWTPARLGRALALVLVLLAAGLGWVWALRRQVQRKRAVIEQQARHAAVLEERSRIARDLHDTLEQGLTGLSLQLKAVELDCRDAPQQVGAGLEAARQMLRRSRALAHQAIRELRTDDLARRPESLVAGLQRVAETWRHSGIDGVAVSVAGDAFPLPPETEQQLLRIAAEAVTNALKHGQATSIQLTLRFQPAGVELRIEDNGAGFDAAPAATEGDDRFGLLGMRERAAAIGAKLDLRSRPGAGACVAIDLPCTAAGQPVAAFPGSGAGPSPAPAGPP